MSFNKIMQVAYVTSRRLVTVVGARQNGSRAPYFPARYFEAPTKHAKDQPFISKSSLLKISV